MRAFSCRGIPSSLEQFIVSSAVVGFQSLVLAAEKQEEVRAAGRWFPGEKKEKNRVENVQRKKKVKCFVCQPRLLVFKAVSKPLSLEACGRKKLIRTTLPHNMLNLSPAPIRCLA